MKRGFYVAGLGLLCIVGLAGFSKESQAATMYRVYNPNSGEHFFTRDNAEKANLLSAGWKDEGIGWDAPEEGEPVYRLYNPNAGDHHYTRFNVERDALIKAGWKDEGVGWLSKNESNSVFVYRAYNPNATGAGAHHYTMNLDELNNLISLGWKDEGIGWYGTAASKPTEKPDEEKPNENYQISYQSFLGGLGSDFVGDGETSGYPDSWIDCIRINSKIPVEVSVKSTATGWTKPVGNNEFTDTKAYMFEAMKVVSKDPNYDVLLRTNSKKGWTEWVRNGKSGVENQNTPIKEYQIKLVKK